MDYLLIILIIFVVGLFITNVLLITTRYVQEPVSFKPSQQDSFGRLRVSNPVGEIDSSNILGTINTVQNSTLVSGSGSVAIIPNTPTILVRVNNGAPSSSATLQSRKRGVYQPGKSLLIFMTGIINPDGANDEHFISRMGYFDDNNGVFLQQSVDGIAVCLRSNVSGSIVDKTVLQKDWNIDTFDGKGVTKIKFDQTKENIFMIDLEWLGVGDVRCGFVIDDVIDYVHEFKNANDLDEIYMYMATLPVRYQALTDGTIASGSLNSNCYSVISEGGSHADGQIYCYSRSVALVVSDNTDFHPVLAIKLDTTALNNIVQLIGLEISTVCTTGGSFTIELRLYNDLDADAVVTTPTFFSPYTVSSALVDDTATTLVNPVVTPPLSYTTIITNFSVADNDAQNHSIHPGVNETCTVNLSNQSSILILCVRKLTGGGDESIFGSITWNEVH